MHEKSIELLNKAVAEEMSALNQYMYFHFHCDDQGYDLLAGLFKRIAIEEMTHVETLAERILFLKGDVDLVYAMPVKKLHDVKAMLELAAEMETEAAANYNRWAIDCGINADSVTKKIFEDLVQKEEGHFDKYDTELDHVSTLGNSYLALQSIERSKREAGNGRPGA